MNIPLTAWVKYIEVLRKVNDKATELVRKYLETHQIPQTTEEMNALIDYAFAVSTKYGEASAAAAAEMYDSIAKASKVTVKPAEPAETPEISEVAKTVVGTAKTNNPDIIADAIGRLVKRTGVDTTMQNAIRDGAEWAWIPQGDTCSFCIMLASNGWQKASKAALKGGHAEHIHANCDCTYAVRFNGQPSYEGYNPDKYRETYDNAEGDTWQEKLNSMRRDEYAKNADMINARKRELYAEKKSTQLGAATTEAIGPSGKRVIDYADAKNFAGDNIKLQNMLRSNDAQQVSEAVDAVLSERFNLPNSAWNRTVNIVPDGSLGRNVVGVAMPNNTIAICKSNSNELSVHIHEHLHMRSVNKQGTALYSDFRSVEEGCVEYLTQEICKKANIEFASRYPDIVESLKYIRKVTLPQMDEYEFAHGLIDMPVTERYNYLSELVKDYRASHGGIRSVVDAKLTDCLNCLE